MVGLIRAIHAGTVTGNTLSVEDRRRCVEHLTLEGYSVVEIAEVLHIAERTVQRDRAGIREANALRPSPSLVTQTVGALLGHAEAAVARLLRIGRDRETMPAIRVEAERTAWSVRRELVVLFQRLGYLPTAPLNVQADVSHVHSDAADLPSCEDLRAEITRMRSILTQSGGGDGGGGGAAGEGLTNVGGPNPEALQVLLQVDESLARLSAAEQLRAVSRLLPSIDTHATDTSDARGTTPDPPAPAPGSKKGVSG